MPEYACPGSRLIQPGEPLGFVSAAARRLFANRSGTADAPLKAVSAPLTAE